MTRLMVALVLVLFGATHIAIAATTPEPRVALVIGNSDYKLISPLRNPVNDARAMARTLRDLGFDVIAKENLTRYEMRKVIRDFGRKLGQGGVGLFYYAGHGMEIGGENYMIPLDAPIQFEDDVDVEAVSVNLLLAKLSSAANRLNIVILDACRNNPYARSFRSTASGLAYMDAPTGTLIAYAAAPGRVALDGKGDNGLYTGELLKALPLPGLRIEDVFKRVRVGVQDKSDAQQVPWESSSLTGDFYFHSPPMPAKVSPEDTVSEQMFWQSIKDSNDRADFEAYLAQYPDGTFAALARNRLRKPKEKQTAAVVPPPKPASEAVHPVVGVYPKRSGETFEDCDACPEMVVIPAGNFMMGAPSYEEERGNNEDPQHRVTIRQPFAVGKYEVMFREWDACVAEGGCNGYRPDDKGWGRGNRPVINVSWDDAQTYLRWLSRKSGATYRLLSEAEWEYAARAGTTTPFHFGSTISTDQANYNGNYTYGSGRKGVHRRETVHVGSFPSNAFGLHDVHGNVWEWVEDCYNGSYAGAPGNGDAWTTGDCKLRVFRGGSWNYDPPLLRAAGRLRRMSDARTFNAGFRVARTLP